MEESSDEDEPLEQRRLRNVQEQQTAAVSLSGFKFVGTDLLDEDMEDMAQTSSATCPLLMLASAAEHMEKEEEEEKEIEQCSDPIEWDERFVANLRLLEEYRVQHGHTCPAQKVYIHIYMYTYINMYACIYMYIYICICIQIYMYIYIYRNASLEDGSATCVAFTSGTSSQLPNQMLF